MCFTLCRSSSLFFRMLRFQRSPEHPLNPVKQPFNRCHIEDRVESLLLTGSWAVTLTDFKKREEGVWRMKGQQTDWYGSSSVSPQSAAYDCTWRLALTGQNSNLADKWKKSMFPKLMGSNGLIATRKSWWSSYLTSSPKLFPFHVCLFPLYESSSWRTYEMYRLRKFLILILSCWQLKRKLWTSWECFDLKSSCLFHHIQRTTGGFIPFSSARNVFLRSHIFQIVAWRIPSQETTDLVVYFSKQIY